MQTSTIEFLSRPWQPKLAGLLASVDESLLIATPYIKYDAAQWLLAELTDRQRQQSIQATILTDISPQSALSASLDITALLLFADHFQRVSIFDVRRLHAKVYVADQKQAIITSGNLTSPAFATNYEYGVIVSDPTMVKKVSNDLQNYVKAGRQVSRPELARLDEASRDFLAQYQQAAGRIGAGARRDLANEWDKIATAFGAPLGLHETGSARFKGPIVEVLTLRGPSTTNELCQVIQASWPYLCDDTLMRTAKDGTRKRQWRHDIHTAQETLQRQGVIRRDAQGLWRLQGGGHNDASIPSVYE